MARMKMIDSTLIHMTSSLNYISNCRFYNSKEPRI